MEGYGTGFAVGKAKAHFEVRNWTPGAHSWDCGCEVCVTARQVVVAFLHAQELRKENERLSKEAS